MPRPWIIITFIESIYHLAGTHQDIHCSTFGMLSMGKSMPERSIVGSMSTMPEISIATSCLATRVDIRIPIDSDTRMNSSDTSTTHIRLPDIGTLIRNTDRQRTISRMNAETTK